VSSLWGSDAPPGRHPRSRSNPRHSGLSGPSFASPTAGTGSARANGGRAGLRRTSHLRQLSQPRPHGASPRRSGRHRCISQPPRAANRTVRAPRPPLKSPRWAATLGPPPPSCPVRSSSDSPGTSPKGALKNLAVRTIRDGLGRVEFRNSRGIPTWTLVDVSPQSAPLGSNETVTLAGV
jgi:hypothetical protein